MYVIDFMLFNNSRVVRTLHHSEWVNSQQPEVRTHSQFSWFTYLQTAEELLTEIIASTIPYSIQEAYKNGHGRTGKKSPIA
jgi:hypothetical protein